MDRSSRGGGNVGNALFAFSKEEENPRSWFWGFSSSGISTAGWIYETLIAGLDHPCSFRFTHKFCYRAPFCFSFSYLPQSEFLSRSNEIPPFPRCISVCIRPRRQGSALSLR